MQESNVALTIEYKGPSVDAGALFAETLTPSLLALSDALKALNRLVNPEGVEAEPSILKFEGGRFELNVRVRRTFDNQVDCLDDDYVELVPCSAELLVDGLLEILMLKKWLAGNMNATFAFNPKIGCFEVKDGERCLVVSGVAWMGFRDEDCCTACSRLAGALSVLGVTTLACSTENRAFVLTAAERAFFERSSFVRRLTDQVMTFSAIAQSSGWLDGHRIRISLGEHHAFDAVMKDEAFKGRIGAGDHIMIDLRVVQRMAGDTLIVEREIVKVHEHHPVT